MHRATAAEVFGLEPEEVSANQRRAAKAINFGLMYGMSAFGLARQLGVDRGEASDYMARYFSRYPGVRAFMDATREQAHRDGYVETMFGRRLYLENLTSRNQALRAGRRTRRGQRTDAGHRRRHHQARHDRRGTPGCASATMRTC